VFAIKSDYGMTEVGYNSIIKSAKNILPEGNRLEENLYVVKSMMKPLGLGYQNIDMCLNFCMLYYGEDVNLIEYKTCGHARYIPNRGKGMTLMAYKK